MLLCQYLQIIEVVILLASLSGKFIISRDVIFDETESQNADEIDNLPSHLEKKLTKGKSIHTKKSRLD